MLLLCPLAQVVLYSLNWDQNETFKTGINKTVEWYINNAEWWKDVLSGAYQHSNK